VGWSQISAKFVDLNLHCFKHRSGLGIFRHLLDPSQLIHGDGDVGARGRLDIMPVDLKKFLIKDARNAVTSWLVYYASASGCACSGVCLFCAAPGAVGVPIFPSDTPGVSFSVPGNAVMADHEKFLRKRQGGGEVLVTVSVTVLVEPSDFAPGFSSKMGSRELLPSWRICTMLIKGAN
jgi:hypothetical protein